MEPKKTLELIRRSATDFYEQIRTSIAAGKHNTALTQRSMLCGVNAVTRALCVECVSPEHRAAISALHSDVTEMYLTCMRRGN